MPLEKMTRTKAREMAASILRDGTNRKQRATQFARDVRDAIKSVGNSKPLERPLHQHFPTACAPLLPSTPTLRALGSLLEPEAQSDSDTPPKEPLLHQIGQLGRARDARGHP